MREDIAEGSLPVRRILSWGRVLSGPRFDERYVMLRLWSFNLFVATGIYGADNAPRSMRVWFGMSRRYKFYLR